MPPPTVNKPVNKPTVALVTGGGAGIGFAIVHSLLQVGHSVVVFDLDAEGAGTAVKALNESFPGKVLLHVGDATSSSDLRDAFDAAEREFGAVEILVNNAGFGTIAPIVDLDEATWNAVIGVLVTGPFLAIQILARRAIAQGAAASIINVSSVNFSVATEGLAHYCAGKAAVSMLTQVAAAELGRHGIRVNAVAPGLIRTALTEANHMTTGRFGKQFLERTPLGRLGEPEDVARVVRLLVSDDAAWINGDTIYVDGGMHVKGLPSYWDTYQATLADIAESDVSL
ncbi:SDR family oxidoreductase [soil metagenome]